MKLPDGVMAFFLLNACNLPEEREKLARATTTDLTYDNMKKQIKKICGSFTGSKDGEAAVPPVKEECSITDLVLREKEVDFAVVAEETDQTEIDLIGKTCLVIEKSQKGRYQEEMLVMRELVRDP
jgi:hypothetical protein